MFGTLLGIDIMGGGASAPDNMPNVKNNNDYTGFLIIIGIIIVFTLICFAINYFKTNNSNNNYEDDDDDEYN